MKFYYQPSDGYVGDVIPFYWQGVWHAFYLKAPLPPARKIADGTSYAHLSSRDLVHWEEWPLVVVPGQGDEPDTVSCWTGSIIERNGVFHLFYVGYKGLDHPQTICHATSRDLHTWEKDAHNPIMRSDPRWYESLDWRDPFVFWNEEQGEYWMLLTARVKDGPANRRGCTALAISHDLDSWEIRPPVWAPKLYISHECPDLFRLQGEWFLLFSEFNGIPWVTHYRSSTSLKGPWSAPVNDSLDGRFFYASKTVSDGKRRLAFGWNPTRKGDTDAGAWEFGGCMVIHEMVKKGKGELGLHALPEHANQFSEPTILSFHSHWGEWESTENTFVAKSTDGSSACTLGDMPECCMIDATIECSPGTRDCGIFLHTDPGIEGYYQLRWEPDRRRVVYDRWPRPGDEPFMMERPVEPAPDGLLHLKVIVDGTVMVAYINESVALSHRAYDHRSGRLGLFVTEGSARFSQVRMSTLKSAH
jgi:beta-fructofuranosidase